jgi:hypothetical protein
MEEQDLGSSYCHQNPQKGEMCIFVREDRSFNRINTSFHCAEQSLKVCAIELETKSSNLKILALYRVPFANFNQFIKRLDNTLKYLYNPKSEFLICGDINVDYLNDNYQKKTNSLLTTNNMSHTVHFVAGTQNDTSTAINNIFVDITRLSSSFTCPIINVLSDHDTQFLTVNNIALAANIVHLKQRAREINNERIMQLQLQFANETSESVHIDNTNNKVRSFLHIFLNIFEGSFPVKYKSIRRNKNGWIAQAIKISCEHKRRLHIYIQKGQ